MDPALRELLRDEEAVDTDRMVEAIIRFRRPGMQLPGVRIVARFGRIATCRIPLGSIREVRRHPDAVSLKAARQLGPGGGSTGHVSMPPNALSPAARRPAGLDLTGAGVVVGVVDWGLDFDHPNFKNPDGSTRLLALWDQRKGTTEPYGYGTVHTKERIDRALRGKSPYKDLGYHPADADRKGTGAHGTHVMDIAAGNGRPSGVAPAADLVFVHLTDEGTRGLANFGDSVRLLEAVDFIARTAGDRPWVINLSMGRHGGPHDGTTLTEMALDELLAAGGGRFIAQSVGNYFQTRTHASGSLKPGETQVFTFVTDPADTSANELEIWYDGDDEFAVRIDPPGTSGAPAVQLGNDAEVKVGRQLVGRIYHRANDPNNGDNHVDAFLYPSAPGGAWKVTIEAKRVGSGTFHAWIERDDACKSCQARFTPADSRSASTTGTIANGHRPLVVGAYDASTPGRVLARNSSSGPTRDRRGKPDLVAPGVKVLAARSAPRTSKSSPGDLVEMTGSSMAAPHVAGAVALCLQAGGHALNADRIRRLVLATADPPGTVTIPAAARIGGGYLNIPALAATVQKAFPRRRSMEESVMYADNTTPLAVVPSRAYRELIYRPDGELARWFGDRFTIVARPGQPAEVMTGDVVLSAALGQPTDRGVCLVVADRQLSRRHGNTPSGPAGWYATVVDPAGAAESRSMRILDPAGCLPPGNVVLRRRTSTADEDCGCSPDAEAAPDAWTGSPEQIEFRDRVLAAHIASKGRPAQRDLLPGELDWIPGTKIKTATETAAAAGRLLDAARAALARDRQAGDPDALRTSGVTVNSGYRSAGYQHEVWLKNFTGYYNSTRTARGKLGDGAHSQQAVDYLLRPEEAGGFGLGGRTAAPGYSNHQGGIAIDLWQQRGKGHAIRNNSDNRSRALWQYTWFHRWLVANAADHHFYQLPTEEWHWEYRPDRTARARARTAPQEAPPSGFLGGKLWTFTSKAVLVPHRVAVFCPKAALGRSEVDVVVYAHGLLKGCPRPKEVPSGLVTDAPFHLGRVVDASDRPMVLVVPLLDWRFPGGEYAFGRGSNHRWNVLAKPEHLNKVVQEALAELGRVQATTAPAVRDFIVAGHSRAYDFLEPLAESRREPAMQQGALARLRQVWAFDTTYAGRVDRWTDWLKLDPQLQVHFFYRAVGDTKKVGDAFNAQRTDRLSVTKVEEGHCAVPAKRMAELLGKASTAPDDPDLSALVTLGSADTYDGESEDGNSAYDEAEPMITFREIDGTPVYYWRAGGRPNTKTHPWRCTQAFYDRLVDWIRDLRAQSSGYGTISYLVSAGFQVDKPGQHGVGTAMDLDHVQWSDGTVSTPLDRHHASSDVTVRRRYLAVDAVCRRSFRYVLDGWYNKAHGDHIHADIESLPTRCRKGSRSDTVFVQAMCNEFGGAGLTVDGRWGPQTQTAFDNAKTVLGVTGDPHTSATEWQSMLAGIARHGFTNQAFGERPLPNQPVPDSGNLTDSDGRAPAVHINIVNQVERFHRDIQPLLDARAYARNRLRFLDEDPKVGLSITLGSDVPTALDKNPKRLDIYLVDKNFKKADLKALLEKYGRDASADTVDKFWEKLELSDPSGLGGATFITQEATRSGSVRAKERGLTVIGVGDNVKGAGVAEAGFVKGAGLGDVIAHETGHHGGVDIHGLHNVRHDIPTTVMYCCPVPYGFDFSNEEKNTMLKFFGGTPRFRSAP